MAAGRTPNITTAAGQTQETYGFFSRRVQGVMSAFKRDPLTQALSAKLEGKPFFKTWTEKLFPKKAGPILKGAGRMRYGLSKYAVSPIRKVGRAATAAGRVTLPMGLAVGAVAMIGVGMMKGLTNASREIVAERQLQDQRYARNITMMSRLGYNVGTRRMNRYNNTAGLSQALSANRHGRGGY